ncbi:MAG: 50S ribosomal protein L17 [Nitrospirota bacterium]
MSGRKLGRNRSHRRALFRNLVTSLLRHERIETTEAKGKEIRAISDKMVSLSLEGSIASRRAVVSYLQDPKVAARLFSEVAPLFRSENPTGGYTRLIKSRIRYGDGAPMVIVELTKRTTVAAVVPTPVPAPAEKVVEKEKTKTKAKAKVAEAVAPKKKVAAKATKEKEVGKVKERPKQKPKEKAKKSAPPEE